MSISHINNFGTNETSNTSAGDTTTPLNSIPSIDAPFYIALDATNINGKYEVVLVTSKTATNINHAATVYAHTTAEEVRCVLPAEEMDALSRMTSGWIPVSESWAYATADAPTFTITVPSGAASTYGVGMKIKLTQSTEKYFIITAVADTVLTVYGGTDYTLANAAISAISISSMKAPLAFPLDPAKWQVEIKDTSDRSGSGTGGTYLNVGTTNAQITIPIGAWDVSYQVSAFGDRTSAGTGDGVSATLSTANNTASDGDFTCLANYYGSGVANSDDTHGGLASKRKFLTLAAKTLYYLNMKMDNNGTWYYKNSTYGSMILRAVCAYL